MTAATADTAIAPGDRPGSGGRLLLGIGGVTAAILGVVVLIHPTFTGVVALWLLALLVALYAFVAGIAYVASAFVDTDRSTLARVGVGVLGVLFVIGGVLIATNMSTVELVLPFWIAITVGVLWIAQGVVDFTQVSQVAAGKGWLITSGVIAVLAGVTLVLSPIAGFAALWWLTGVAMIVLGVLQAVRSFSNRA